MIRRSRLLAPAALTTALLLSACGGGGTSSSDEGAVQQGPAKLTQAALFTKTAAAAKKTSTAHLTGVGSIQGQKLTFSGDLKTSPTPQDSAFGVVMRASGLTLKMRLVDRKLYINPGKEAGNKYFVLDPNDTSNPISQQFGQLFNSFDPTKQLEASKAAITSFKAGDDTTTIDGVETRPYTVVVDTRKVLEASGQKIPAEALTKLPKTSTSTVWVGADDRTRRVRSSLGDTFTFTMNFTKWGEPVTIEKPAASEISKENPFAKAA